jgi:hypothetical protein
MSFRRKLKSVLGRVSRALNEEDMNKKFSFINSQVVANVKQNRAGCQHP